MELREALARLGDIQQRLSDAEVYRGYRAIPVAASGLLAGVAAIAQSAWLPHPSAQPSAYLLLWSSVAALSIGLTGLCILLRDRCLASPSGRAATRRALGHLAPCLLSGALLTAVIALRSPESLALLPGLWQILFSQGIFASRRVLPRGAGGVALFYLFSGLMVLAVAQGKDALAPWAMGVPFFTGQLLAAWVLHHNSERHHES